MDGNQVKEMAVRWLDSEIGRLKALRVELAGRRPAMTPEREAEVRGQILAGRARRQASGEKAKMLSGVRRARAKKVEAVEPPATGLAIARKVFEEAKEAMTASEALQRARALGWDTEGEDPGKVWSQVLVRLRHEGTIRKPKGQKRSRLWEKAA